MHIRLWLILILIAHPFDTVGELFSRKSIIPDTSVDYLIVTPEVFEGNAARLARHRNAFKGDDVERADVIRLSELLSLHDSLFGNSGNSIPIYHKIREILQVFITTHFKNLRYIVFFGTDSIGWNGEKEHPESYGSMPSYIAGIGMDSYDTSNDTIIDYSDEFYILDTNGNDNGILPGIGRIPCATNEQADRYISKIIDFDNGIHDGPWRNKALLLADDAMKGEEIDPINYQHFDAAEGIDSLLDRQKYITSKVYLSAFRKDSYGIHREAGAAFLQRVGDGALWTVFFGHGNPGGLTNEGFITADMAEQLNNSGKPTIFISLSCQNGAFHLPTGQSMGKRFLFTLGGGALAYIASTNLEFSDANQTFMQEFFRIHDSLPNASIGILMRLAKRRCTPNRLEYYHILGDPALVPVRKKHPIHLSASWLPEKNTRQLMITSNKHYKNTHYRVSVLKTDTIRMADDPGITFLQDSIRFSESGRFVNFIRTDVPFHIGDNMRIHVYIWNSVIEGTIDTSFIVPSSSNIVNIGRNSKSTTFTIDFPEKKFIRITSSMPINDHINIRIFALNGRLVHSDHFILPQSSFTIDPKRIGLSSGTYIITLVHGRNHGTFHFTYYAG